MKYLLITFSLSLIAPVISAADQNLPAPVSGYFSAIAQNDRKALSDLYTEKAKILEVNRTISGKKAILRWADNEVFGGKYTILRIIAANDTQAELIVEFIPKGAASGFRANYKFQLTSKQINYMNLQYAD
ncbi:MAG: nuclear transport factor 2 family protein [Leptospiraceae bacterium]|nr:nuclear transport factor 2 family protein [Leptospiraceae bacterium]